MRKFNILILLAFTIFYILITAATFLNLKNSLSHYKLRKSFTLIYLTTAVSLLLIFIVLYIYPLGPDKVNKYTFYLYFNAAFLTLFVFNLPMVFSYIVSLPFKKELSRLISTMGLILSIGIGITVLYGFFIGSRTLRIEKHTIEYKNLPKGFDNYKVVQLSDLHIGGLIKSENILNRIIRIIEDESPDLILLTGDIVNNFSSELEEKDYFLKSISSVAPTFSILGNHDYGDYTRWDNIEEKNKNFNNIIDFQVQSGVKMLNNKQTIIHHNGDSIYLIGVENWGYPPFPRYADLEKAFEGISNNTFKILMTHDPAHWENLPDEKMGVDLTLSGHTHGMQLGVMIAGIQFSPASLTRNFWGGLYQNGDAVLYVNRGLGTVGIPCRIDMPPEITIITLTRNQ